MRRFRRKAVATLARGYARGRPKIVPRVGDRKQRTGELDLRFEVE
jgi:hypothetical protein